MTGLMQALARLAGAATAAFVAEYRKGLAQSERRTELSCTGARVESAWRPTHEATMPARSFGFAAVRGCGVSHVGVCPAERAERWSKPGAWIPPEERP